MRMALVISLLLDSVVLYYLIPFQLLSLSCGTDTELPRNKKVKMKSPEAEAEPLSSSSSDNSCFVALVTASSLRTDKLVFTFTL